MKQKLQKIFTVFMVLTILVSSHAFAYYEHICLLTRVKTYSIEPKTCAGKGFPKESKSASFKRPSCCELHLKVLKVDNGLQNQIKIPVQNQQYFCLDFPVFDFTFLAPNIQKVQNFVFSNSSPPKQKLFVLYDQFLI